MLAPRADEVGGQLFALVDIAADRAAPHRFAGRRGLFLGLRLDVCLIVGVGGGRRVREDVHVVYRGDEQRVAAEVDALLHAAADKGVGSRRDVVQPVFAAAAFAVVCKLVGVSARLKAEVTEDFKIRLLAQNRKIEFAALNDKIVREVVLVDGNADAVGGLGDLSRRIDDAAAVPAVKRGGQDKQTVGQAVHGFFIHRLTPLDSSAPPRWRQTQSF